MGNIARVSCSNILTINIDIYSVNQMGYYQGTQIFFLVTLVNETLSIYVPSLFALSQIIT